MYALQALITNPKRRRRLGLRHLWRRTLSSALTSEMEVERQRLMDENAKGCRSEREGGIARY
jgi:hypothetical protein